MVGRMDDTTRDGMDGWRAGWRNGWDSGRKEGLSLSLACSLGRPPAAARSSSSTQKSAGLPLARLTMMERPNWI